MNTTASTPRGETLSLFVNNDGSVTFIHDDDVAQLLNGLGSMTVVRASHVEPDPDNPGSWVIDLRPLWSSAPSALGPFPRRDLALAAERILVTAWLAGQDLSQLHPNWVQQFLTATNSCPQD